MLRRWFLLDYLGPPSRLALSYKVLEPVFAVVAVYDDSYAYIVGMVGITVGSLITLAAGCRKFFREPLSSSFLMKLDAAAAAALYRRYA